MNYREMFQAYLLHPVKIIFFKKFFDVEKIQEALFKVIKLIRRSYKNAGYQN